MLILEIFIKEIHRRKTRLDDFIVFLILISVYDLTGQLKKTINLPPSKK